MLRGSNINVFNFESKIYEIENEDEEVVTMNGPIFHFEGSNIFHFIFKDVIAHRTFFILRSS